MKKCAYIRSNEGDRQCPFGLPITEACEHAGDSVTHMCPIEFVEEDEKKKMVQKANARVYIYYKTGARCLYAASVIKDKRVVNCDFGDTAMGIHMPKGIEGSPLYAQTFSGIGLDGLYAYPLGFYADNNESRNLFQGLFSLVGERNVDIIKEAAAELSRDVVSKLESNEKLTRVEMDEVVKALDTCRQDWEGNRDDTGKMKEISDKWNSRKRL